MTFPNAHALLIGVGADLPHTIDDALGLAAILCDEARCAYPPAQVQTLTGAQASRDRILAALEQLAQTTDADSTVIVYFSGHGYRVTSTMGGAYYLMPAGYDMQRLYQTAISGSEFAGRLRAIPARKLVLLLDCCHAGGVGAAKGLELTKAPLPPEAQQLLAEGRGRALIASSRADELSYAGAPYSAFTLALIEALCGVGVATRDGYVRLADLALHAREMVPRRTHDQQHPILHFEQADNFALAYYAGGDTQPKAPPFVVEPQIEPTPGAWSQAGARQQISGNAQVGAAVAGDVHGNVTATQQDNRNQRGGINFGSGNRLDNINIGDVAGHDIIKTGDISGSGIAIGRGARSDVRKINTGGGDYAEGNIDKRKGSFVSGDQFNMSGNFSGAILNIKSTLSNVTQSIGLAPHGDATTKSQLQALIAQLNAELQKVPAEQAADAEAVAETTKAVIAQATKAQPNKTLVQISAEGLKQAAQNLAAVLPAVVPLAQRIAELLVKLGQ